MGKLKVILNTGEVGNLLKSEEMRQICEEHASAALSVLGSGYNCGTYMGTDRVKADVFAETAKAKRENLKYNTILKAIRG